MSEPQTSILPGTVRFPDEPPLWLQVAFRHWDACAPDWFAALRDFDREVVVHYPWLRAYRLMPKSQQEWQEREARSGSLIAEPIESQFISNADECDAGLFTLPRRLWNLCCRAHEVISLPVRVETMPAWPEWSKLLRQPLEEELRQHEESEVQEQLGPQDLQSLLGSSYTLMTRLECEAVLGSLLANQEQVRRNLEVVWWHEEPR